MLLSGASPFFIFLKAGFIIVGGKLPVVSFDNLFGLVSNDSLFNLLDSKRPA